MQAELADTATKLAAAKVAAQVCSDALDEAGQAQGPETEPGNTAEQTAEDHQGTQGDDMDYDEEVAAGMEKRLREALGTQKHHFDQWNEYENKRRKNDTMDLRESSPAEAMEAGAATAAAVGAAAKAAKEAADKVKAAKEASDKAAADEKAKQKG